MRPTRKVMLAVPSMDGKVSAQMFMSAARDIATCGGYSFTIALNIGGWPISRARNILTEKFLMSDCEDMFFIDTDIGWGPGALPRLLDHPVDVVAGIYPKRTEDYTDYPVAWGPKSKLDADPETGLFEAECVATGFLRIRRHVMEKMVAAYPETAYSEMASPRPDGVCHALFDFILEPPIYYGEDFTFCRRWRRIGGKVWVDTNIDFEHVGDKVHRGNLDQWLRAGMPGHPLENAGKKSAA